MKALSVIASAAVLLGCAASPPPAPKPTTVVKTEAPRCSTKRQCEAMWIQAQNEISRLTGMRIRVVTDNRIETFAPSSAGTLWGLVTKTPVGQEDYRIDATLECYRYIRCPDLQAQGINIFNISVSMAGKYVK